MTRLFPSLLALCTALFLAGLFHGQALAAEAGQAEKVHATDTVTVEKSGGHAEKGEHAEASGHEEGGEHGLPQAAPILWELGWFKVTNSMVTMWVVALGLIVVAQVATRKISMVPRGLQNLVEAVVEGLQTFLAGILGREMARKTYWFFATIFIFILCANWFGLIPGVGSIGYGIPTAEGASTLKHVARPLFRGANADLNMTFGMAAVFMLLWLFWSIQANGIGGFLKHIFWPAEDKMGAGMAAVLALPFLFAGILEIVSIAFRPVSLSFRLYGNIFAGENLLETMITISPKLGWLAAIPFYFMELLVGAVQALVFMLLTAVFTGLMTAHGDHGHEEKHGHGEAPAH